MKIDKLFGVLKIFLVLFLLIFTFKFTLGANYLPSTKYINIQTNFDQLDVTLEKFNTVDAIAYCKDFNGFYCPKWTIYDTNIQQNESSVTFSVYDKGAFIGINLKTNKKNLTQIKNLLEVRNLINITQINYTTMGLNIEFNIPLKGRYGLKEIKDAKIKMFGLKNESKFKKAERIDLNNVNVNGKKVKMSTEVVALDAHGFKQAQIQLPKKGEVNTILRCGEWDFTNNKCSLWQPTSIPFTEDDKFVYFNVSGFSAYGGAELNILNVQSYPVTGSYWVVKFTTKGTADLRVEGSNGTEYGVDLNFTSLYCGNNEINAENHNSYIYVKNYTCNSTGYYKVKVLTGGHHTQKFTFGSIVAYARNLADNMPNKMNVEGKITNSSDDNLNGTYNVTYKIYDSYTGGNLLWEEKLNTTVNDGVFSTILGNVHELNLTWAEPYYLELMVETETMSPRINLSSAPYAKAAQRSWNLSCVDCINEVQIGDLADLKVTGLANITGWLSTSNNISTPKLCLNGDCKTAWPSGSADSGWSDGGTTVGLVTKSDDVNATSLYVDNANSKVGIGTDNPSKALDVNNGSQGITLDPSATKPTINTTASSDLLITSASGNVIVQIG